MGLITGKGSEIGDFLTQHPGVNAISFTGGDTGGWWAVGGWRGIWGGGVKKTYLLY